MSKRTLAKLVLLIVGSIACAWAFDAAWAADAPAARKQQRSAEEIQKDIAAATTELRGMLTSPSVIFDEKKRAEAAPKMIPVMKRTLGLFEELAGADEGFKRQFEGTRRQFLAMLSLVGDAESAELLAKDAASPDAARAVPARGAQLVVRWWKSPSSAEEQGKVLDELSKL